MDYITIKRFKRIGMDGGLFNIPFGTTVEEQGGTLVHNGRALVRARSAACHEYFARNDDGCGKERGRLTQAIVAALALCAGETQDERDKRWEPIFADKLCQSYRRKEHADTFLWSNDFYNAPIVDLRHIAALAGVK